MHLESPLFLLLYLPLGAWWMFVRSIRKMPLFTPEILHQLMVEQRGRTSQPKSFFLAMSLIVFALAQPVLHVNKESSLQTHHVSSLAIAIDISNSMLARDVAPNRLEFSKMAVEQIMEKLTSFRIALLAFSNDGFLVAPFSEDKASLSFLLKHLDPSVLSSEGSSIPSAIRASQKLFGESSSKDLLIITDGADGEKIEASIDLARKEQIRVHLFLVGSEQGAMIDTAKGEALKDSKGNLVITKRADALKALALKTDGAYVMSSGGLADLGWLCDQIAQKASKNEVQTEDSYTLQQLFYYPLGMALVLLFVGFHTLHVKRWSLLLLLPFTISPAHSGMLDWWWIDQAKGAYEKGDFPKAVNAYEKLNETHKSDEVAYNLANALYQTKQYEKALALYKDVKEASLLPKALHNEGNALAKLGRFEEAIEAYDKALSLHEDEDTRFNRELLKQQQKNEKTPKDDATKPHNEMPPEQKQDENTNEEKTAEKQERAQESSPKMDEKEAKKWERTLLKTEPKTKPMKLYQSDSKEREHANNW